MVYLKDLVVILGFAVIVVILFHRLKLPSIAGFILSGILMGPQVLGLIDDADKVEMLAEIGVALLLFGIGVELSLKKMQRLWKLTVIGGFLQVGLTAGAAFLVGGMLGLQGNTALFVGFVVAMSSTPIVLHGLQQRGEVDAPHGRLIVGISIFQDLSVVPIMLIVPIIIGESVSAGAFIITLVKSAGIVVAVLLLAMLVVPRILKIVTRTRNRQLFILSVFVICLGTAWLVTRSGTSLAIGAFMAGLVVSGSEYRHQALADMISFREVFASLFFVSVGMLLSPVEILGNLLPIIILLVSVLLGKAIIVFITAEIMRLPLRTCVTAAVALAQVGEFAFILLHFTRGTGLLATSLENGLVSVAILSMFVVPLSMPLVPRLATGLGRLRRLGHLLGADTAEDVSDAAGRLHNHIIVAGYGFAGRELSRVLEGCKIPYIVVDLNIENVRTACRETGRAVFGDVTSDGVLTRLGIEHARELVILINDPGAAEHAVRVARRLAPHVFITVRTVYLLDVEPLLRVGANEVISAEREAAVQVATEVMKRHGVDSKLITREMLTIRGHSEEPDS